MKICHNFGISTLFHTVKLTEVTDMNRQKSNSHY